MIGHRCNFGPYELTLYQWEAGNVENPPPLIVGHYLEDPDSLWQQLSKDDQHPCHLAAITGVSESEFLPYPCPELGERFSSAQGLKYYQTLTTVLIPALKAQLTVPVAAAPIIAGYSLAGLFALWAAAQADSPFERVISCSGSLWYPGVLEAIALPPERSLSSVYLSVGAKEKNSGPKMFREVERCTREAYERYQDCAKALVLNPGGHFTQVTERLYQGIAWTLQEYYRAQESSS